MSAYYSSLSLKSFLSFNWSSFLPDATLSQWSVQVELFVTAVEETHGQVTLSIPDLATEQAFHASFLQGRTKNTYMVHINTVLTNNVCVCVCVRVCERERENWSTTVL